MSDVIIFKKIRKKRLKERPVRILALRETIIFFAVSAHFLSIVRKLFLYLQPKESL